MVDRISLQIGSTLSTCVHLLYEIFCVGMALQSLQRLTNLKNAGKSMKLGKSAPETLKILCQVLHAFGFFDADFTCSSWLNANRKNRNISEISIDLWFIVKFKMMSFSMLLRDNVFNILLCWTLIQTRGQCLFLLLNFVRISGITKIEYKQLLK